MTRTSSPTTIKSLWIIHWYCVPVHT